MAPLVEMLATRPEAKSLAHRTHIIEKRSKSLSSDLHTCTVACTLTYPPTHPYNKMNVKAMFMEKKEKNFIWLIPVGLGTSFSCFTFLL